MVRRLGFVVAVAAASCGPGPRRPSPPVAEHPDAAPAPGFDPAASAAQIRTLLRGQKYDQALAAARAHVEAALDDDAGPLLVAEALLLAGSTDDAVAMIEGLAAERPDDVDVQTLVGWSLERTGRVDEASEALRAVVEKDPTHPRALRLLGMIRRAQFEIPESVALLVRATAADPLDAEAWFQLGIAQNELGDNKKPEAALVAYLRAAEGPTPHPKAVSKQAHVL